MYCARTRLFLAISVLSFRFIQLLASKRIRTATPSTVATLDQLHALLNSGFIIDSADNEDEEAVEIAPTGWGAFVTGLLALVIEVVMASPVFDIVIGDDVVDPLIEGNTGEEASV